MTSTDVLSRWRRLGSVAATTLVDSRLQLHHALQIIVSAPISFLEKRADDSHTNLEWLPAIEALGTNWLDRAGRIRVALRPAALSLLAVDGRGGVTSEYALDGRTTADAVAWLRESLGACGYDSAALTTKKHYEIPPHRVASGHAYDLGSGESFAELGRYYGNAHEVASYVATTRQGASSVRCWPHHFDLATLITLPEIAGRGSCTIGVGLSPGDDLYAEPYFYVGPYPHPSCDRLRPLG
ncbi:MAG: hypothetical protein ACREOG_02610, partial [Gemmatimonadaceae bacterium]